MNTFNGLAMGGTQDFNGWGSMVALFASRVLAFVVAILLFSWDRRNTKRRGHPIKALLFFLLFIAGLLPW